MLYGHVAPITNKFSDDPNTTFRVVGGLNQVYPPAEFAGFFGPPSQFHLCRFRRAGLFRCRVEIPQDGGSRGIHPGVEEGPRRPVQRHGERHQLPGQSH